MHKKIFFFGFIIAIGLGSIVSTMSPEVYLGTAVDNSSKVVGGTLGLFVVTTIVLYIVVYTFKLILKPLLRYIGKDFQKGNNFFENIFYSKLLGPAIITSEKNNIIKSSRGRLFVIFYLLTYILTSIIILIIAGMGGDEDVFMGAILFLLLGIIPYKYVFPVFRSIPNYINGVK